MKTWHFGHFYSFAHCKCCLMFALAKIIRIFKNTNKKGFAIRKPFSQSLFVSCNENGQLNTFKDRPFKACTGRLLVFSMFLKAAICAAEAVIGVFMTNQVTISEQGGVVNEPA